MTLWLLFLLSLAGMVTLRLWFPLRPHYLSNPLPDIVTFTPNLAAGLAYGGLLAALFGLHGLAVSQLRQRPRRSPWLLLLGAALLAAPLVATFPVNGADVFRYVIVGRIASVYGADPFAVPPSAFPDDPFLPLAGEWAGATSPYGPVWEMVAWLISALAGGRFWPILIAFKALQAAALIGAGGLIWSLTRQRGDEASASMLLVAWAWNPALLMLFVGDGHNDALMIFCLIAGWWLLKRGRPAAGFIAALLGGLVKPIGLLALPFLLLAGWRQAEGPLARRRFLLIAAAGGLALGWLSFLPFGSPLNLARRLMFESGDVAGFSPATLVVLLLQRLGLPGGLAQVRLVATGALAMGLLLLAWRAWQGRESVVHIGDGFLYYIWSALAFRIWYAAWPFAWWLLAESADRRRRAGFWMLITAQFSVLIYGHLWRFALGRDHLWSHLIGVPFTFVLPWLLARRPRADRDPGPMPASIV